MLFFVGLGLEQSPTLRAIDALKKCDQIFYESYTSVSFDQNLSSSLSDCVGGKEIHHVRREFVEDGRRILEHARDSNVALVCSGDPMVATTHQDLRVRAIHLGIQTKIIHGSSILCALSGELGLSSYSFGKTVTMIRSPMHYTAYLTIYQNLLRGLHTALLLEWDEAERFFLSPSEAVTGLLDAEKDLKYGIITADTLLLGISEVGKEDRNPRITSCAFGDALSRDFGIPPLTLVVPGKLHFTETEALSALTQIPADSFRDNSKNIERVAERMLAKYSQKTLAALKRARSAATAGSTSSSSFSSSSSTDANLSEVEKRQADKRKKKYEPVFENVELYTQDAMRFLNEGKEELAVLSIGYAEGLLDSLRFSGELDFEW